MSKDLHKKADHVDTERREFLERLVQSTAFTVPLVLGLDLISSQKARAEEASSSESTDTTSSGTDPASSTPDPVSSTPDPVSSTPDPISSTPDPDPTPDPTTSTQDSTATSSSEDSSVWIDPNPVDSGGTTSVPEPSTLAVLGLGLAGLALKARRAKLQEKNQKDDA